MSTRRKLLRKAKLDPIAMNAPPHGCEECRSEEWRSAVMKDMMAEALSRKVLGDAKVFCKACEASWLVSLFPFGPKQELRISFKPIANEQLN